MTTLYDVAKAAGVSTATVSRVVHGLDRVRAATRERVERVIEELGYVPDSAAQSLSRRRKEVIGLVGIERLDPESDIESTGLLFVEEILRGVEATLRGEGWSLLISFLQSGERAYEHLRSLSGKVDGLLLVEGMVDQDHLARLARRLPVVVVAGAPEAPIADVVAADNRAGTLAVVEHLIAAHGQRELCYVSGPPDAPDARERLSAFESALAGHDRARAIGVVDGRFSADSGRSAAKQVLGSGELPGAVVCANDLMAIGFMHELHERDVRVPSDLAVVGFDDIYPGSLWHPALTTVRQPMRELGVRASSRLLQRIAEPDLPPAVEILPTELVVRESCGCARGEHPAVRDGRRAGQPLALRAPRSRRPALAPVVGPARPEGA